MKGQSGKLHSPPRVAIVGAGLMGQWHADAVHRIGGTVSVIVDRDEEKAAQLFRLHPKASIAPDFASILKANLADVAHICTPAHTHEALARQALEAGLHLLVEKPMTETMETTAKLLQLAESKHLFLCPVHQFLFQPGVLRAQNLLAKFGALLHLDTLICSAGAERALQDADLVVADILPGPLSLIARLVPNAIGNASWRVEHAAKGELRASTSVEDVSISVLVSLGGRPTVNSLRLIGERGSVHADLFHGYSVMEPGTVSRTRKIARPFLRSGATIFSAATNLAFRARRREPAYPGLRELIRRFYESLRNGGSPPISHAETLAVAAARDRILSEMHRRT
jgi:predicted dehydrogenase